MMSLIKNELLVVSVSFTLVSVEAGVSDILALEATSGITSHYIDKEMRKKKVLCEKHCIM